MKTILLIEDDPDIRDNITELLELTEYRVMSASNGIEGITLLKSVKPDLILCDIMMPELDGYGVLEIVNQNPETAGIPFIFMTAKSEKEDARKGMKLGADDYITKPFSSSELLSAIESRIARIEKVQKGLPATQNDLNQFLTEPNGCNFAEYFSSDRKTKTFARKAELYRQDETANSLYLILKGKVKCIRTDANGKSIVTEICDPDSFIGYLTLLEDGVYHETAIAMEETEVVVIPKKDFSDLLLSNREISGKFIKLLSKGVLEREKRLLKIAYAPVRERVATALLNLYQLARKKNEHQEIKISRDELASIVGTAKESLIRMLSEIKKDELIETDGNLIRILNEDGLKKMSGD